MASLLESKVVIVTGGGHGIGRAYCLAIAREGGHVAVADIDVAAAERVAREVGEAGGEALPLQTDVANLNSCVDMTQRTVTHFGQIDGLVNNAAIYLTIPAPAAPTTKSRKRNGIAPWPSTSRGSGSAPGPSPRR